MCNCNGSCGNNCKCKKRYVVGKDFNTKDWFVYDNEKGFNICNFDTEDEANKYVDKLLTN